MAPETIKTSLPAKRQVGELRESSRRLVRVLGFLQSPLERVDCSAAQCHALVELSLQGQLTTGELAELLEVDKSTASRTVGSLLRAKLVAVQADPGDQRTKPVSLTTNGRQRVLQIHSHADGQVAGALELLNDEERATVLRGVSLYEEALHRAKALAGLVVRPIESRDDAAMARVIRTVMTEFGAVGQGYSITDAEVDAMHQGYASERRAYFVAERDGELLAGGGIAPLDGSAQNDVCELRKMYALSSARGLGIGRQLLEHCLAAARAAGFRLCYLETLKHMHSARTLYEKFGFKELDAPMGDTGHHGCDGWFALEL
ncbi:MAG: putative acetyltransferase [Pseudohongiellaceae bacterium]|jgi:putative acetyltransferase